MVGELFGTAGRLWREAPAWKITVIAAGAFTAAVCSVSAERAIARGVGIGNGAAAPSAV